MATRNRAKAVESPEATPARSSTEEALQAQSTLRARIEQLRAEHEQTTGEVFDLRQQREHAAVALSEYKLFVAQANGDAEPSGSQQREIERLQENLEALTAKQNAAEQQGAQLSRAILGAQADLLVAAPSCTLKDIEAHANAMRQAQAAIDEIAAAIARVPSNAEREAALHKEVAQLNTKREDLRAAAVMGSDTAKEIEAVNAAIAKAEVEIESIWKEASNAEEAAAGLQRRLDAEQSRLDDLSARTQALVHAYLVTLVEHHRAAYLTSAASLIDSTYVLIGLQGALERFGGGGDLRRIFPGGFGGLAIPTLWDTSGVEMPVPRERDGFLFSAEKSAIYQDFDAKSLTDDVLDVLRPILDETPSRIAARRPR